MSSDDASNGYEEIAEAFQSSRNRNIGAAAVREWSMTLPRGCAVLDLGCGPGVPISSTLIEQGHPVYGGIPRRA